MNHGFGRLWTAKEDAVVRSRYGKVSAALISKRVGHSTVAVFHRAKRLGLISKRRWTADDDRELREMWSDHALRTIASKLNRTQYTTYWRAELLGLPRGCPDGWEYMRRAATRTGFHCTQIRAIVAWAEQFGFLHPGIPAIRLSMARPKKGQGHRWTIVDTTELDTAIGYWLKAETIEVAARARGLTSEIVRKAVSAFGERADSRPGRRKQWRIPSEQIDAALEQRAKRESVTVAARRHGTSRSTLTRRLREAGVDILSFKQRAVLRSDVDRVLEGRAA